MTGGDMKYRVLRGGSWFSLATFSRSADRVRGSLDYRSHFGGFRVVAIARTQ